MDELARKRALFEQIAADIARKAENGQKNREDSAPAAPRGSGGTDESGKGKKVTITTGDRIPPERTNPNKGENEFMMNLMVTRNGIKKYAPGIRARAVRAGKWVWRDIRLMERLIDKVQQQLMDTMPDRRQDYYIAYSRHGHYELHMDGPVRPERMVLIGDRSLATILEQLMEDECLMCFRDGDEIGKCPLRQVMLEVAVPNELEDGRWRKCEYREAARQLLKGENVTI